MKQMSSKGAGNLGVNSPKDYYGAEDVPLARPGDSVDHDEGPERGDDGETLPPTFQPTFGRKLLIFVTYSCVIFAISSPLASYPAMVKDVPGFGVSSSFFVLGVATAETQQLCSEVKKTKSLATI